MIDSTTKKPIRVRDQDPELPYLVVPATQVDEIRSVFDSNGVRFRVDSNFLSFNGQPAVRWVYLARGTDAGHVQSLLDTVG